ncbi:MSHA biogenesis protein MshN [Photobacterium aphoticum]|uniref:MSHA biogenesis protein MshN n=1 Tax=Photobacterium aphoticum TaxID=754436 RepID=A0A090QT63_9GAMM|nr:MSHA biogenesis protein MshN [Photobacterium aphoticum]
MYYGRKDNRRAMAILQQGLQRDSGQSELRVTMAKLLVNESQEQAALSVLQAMPDDGNSRYLAMRGALAQQLHQPALALSSYQRLVHDQPMTVVGGWGWALPWSARKPWQPAARPRCRPTAFVMPISKRC